MNTNIETASASPSINLARRLAVLPLRSHADELRAAIISSRHRVPLATAHVLMELQAGPGSRA